MANALLGVGQWLKKSHLLLSSSNLNFSGSNVSDILKYTTLYNHSKRGTLYFQLFHS